MTRFWGSITLLTFGIALASYAAEPPKSLTARDILSFKCPSQAVLSPDGKHVLFTVRQPDFERSQFYSHIWIVSTNDRAPRQLSFSEGSEHSPSWSPDGKWIAFLSDRPYRVDEGKTEQKSQLWIMSSIGEAQRLTDMPKGVRLYRWLSTADRIIFATDEPLAPDEKLMRESRTNLKYDARVAGEKKPNIEIWVLDLFTKESSRICATDPGLAEIDVSPDGKWLVYSTNYTGEMNDDQKYDLWLVSIETGEKRQLTDFSGPETSPRISPDGTRIAYISQTLPDIEFAQTDLSLIDLETDGVSNLTIEFNLAVSEPVWAVDGSAVYVSVAAGTNTHLYRITLRDGTIAPLSQGVGVFGNLSLSADGSAFSLLREDARSLPEVFVRTGTKTQRLTEFSNQLDDYSLGEQQLIRYQNEGYEIEALLVLPVDYEEGTQYPLILFVHGGPYGRFLNRFRQSYMFQLFANRGYVVMAPNPRGSSGYSDSFGQANRDDLGGGDYRDLMGGVMYVADLSIGDFERMGIIGGSYGGYLVNWAVTQTDRFRAAVSMYGIFSLFTDWGTSVQPLWEKMYFGSYYWENTPAYVEHSPAFNAQFINTPVLILHGEDDDLTFISNSKEMYQTLTNMGKPVEFITYPREGHGLRSEPNHIIDKMDRIMAWFDKYVKPAVEEEIENEELQSEPE